MMPPPFNADPSDEGIPAADPGTGAPEPAPGFGIGGEDPDVVASEDPRPEEAAKAEEADPREPGATFRTPDPRDIGPRSAD
ncbi:hypothetical protein [Blastococcus deserti]|uniref:Uncharacterized protein n=1 Tax=Blastococcus deserti TaxID=2259033 RepID=A0ABW4X6D7_9ACTN